MSKALSRHTKDRLESKVPEIVARTEMPVLGCGTFRMDSNECYRAVQSALKLGYRHVDTAAAYDNESAVGRAIDVSPIERRDVHITTKVKGYPENLSYDAFIKAARESLARLGSEHIDLLLVHWWHPRGDMEEVCAALDRLVDEGLVRSVGVSNFSVEQMQQAIGYLDAPLMTNQVEYHVYRRQDDLLQYCLNEDVILTAYSPLAEGRLVSDPLLEEISDRYDATPAQVAIRWLIQQDGVATIPKSSNPTHLRKNAAVFHFELTGDDMRRIADHEGPLLYRLTRDGGPIQRARHCAGKHVPSWVRERVGTA